MMAPSKWQHSRSCRWALIFSFVLGLTAVACAQTKPSDNPPTPTQAEPSTRKVELLRDRLPLEHIQSIAANEQDSAPSRQELDQNSPVIVAAGKCPTGQTSCSGVCTNTSTSLQNCGSCGHACGTGTSCVNGACVQNLLANGTSCQTSSQCSSGSCAQGVCCNTSCGSCSNGTLQACNFTGNVGTCAAVSCGAYACSSNSACFTNCSNDTNCNASSYCNLTNSVCMPKSPSGAPCTVNNQCMSGSCVTNACR